MGSDPNATNGRGYTPLHVSTEAGSDTSTTLLLQRGADPNIATSEEATPKEATAKDGKVSEFCETPFHIARSPSAVNALLENGGNPFAIMKYTHRRGETKRKSVLSKLLKEQPQAAIKLFDHAISTNGQPIKSDELWVIYDYELFYREGLVKKKIQTDDDKNDEHKNNDEQQQNDELVSAMQECDEMAVHRKICKYGARDILHHPLAESFLKIKCDMVFVPRYTNLAFFMMFTCAFAVQLLQWNFASSCTDPSSENGKFKFCRLKDLFPSM